MNSHSTISQKTLSHLHSCDRDKFLTHFILIPILLVLSILPKPVYSTPLTAIFNGSGTLQNSISLNGLTSFTLECWMRSDSFAQQAVIFHCGHDSTSGFDLGLTNTLVPGRESYATLSLGSVSQIATGNSFRVPFHQWVHVAIIRTATEWMLYRNGAIVGRTRSPGIGPNDNIILGMGFSGALTRFRIWSRALGRAELVTSMCSMNIHDSNLIAEYTPQNVGSVDSVQDVLGLSPSLHAEGTIIAISDPSFPNYGTPFNISLETFPIHMQFFARDNDDSARISIIGSMSPLPGDSLVLELYKDDSLFYSTATLASNQFNFIVPIHCELSEYTIRLFVLRSENKLFVAEAADLLCGDVFLIDGQSNAHPAIDGYNWQNAFSRTLGVQTTSENLDPYDPADTLWGLSSATGWGQLFSGPYLVGSWARWMQEGVAAAWNVPTCVINGAAGGSTITQHFRNDSNPTDSSTIYGKLLYRTIKSGLAHHVRGIFWYQGEWDNGATYLESFRNIYNDWLSNYSRYDTRPIFHFIFQTRPNDCGTGDGLARESQREIQDSFPNCTTLSTVAIDGYSGCHYYWNGYVNIGQEVIRKVGKYFYNSADSIDVDPPDISDARFTDQSHTKIAIRFRGTIAGLAATPDTVIDGVNRTIKDAFYLDGTNNLNDSIEFSHNTAFLYLHASSFATTLSYIPTKTYDNDSTVYTGPWIVNTKGEGALTFYQYPIGEPGVQEIHSLQNTGSCIRVVAGSSVKDESLIITLSEPGWTKIELVDILGRISEKIAYTWMDAGQHILNIHSQERFQFATLFCSGKVLVAKLLPIP
jgi:hypothetical protein